MTSIKKIGRPIQEEVHLDYSSPLRRLTRGKPRKDEVIELTPEFMELQKERIKRKREQQRIIQQKWINKDINNKFKLRITQTISRNREKLTEEQIEDIKSIDDKQVAFNKLYRLLHPSYFI